MRHKHADLMIEYANNKDLKIQWCNSIGGEWVDAYVPCFHEDAAYRIKPNIQRYRVALMKVESTYYTSTQDEGMSFNPEMSPQFVCWRTDWIEYEVPSTSVD